MGTLILIIVCVMTLLLGRYALNEGRRIERQKKFWKNIEEHDKKNKTNEWDL
tara:strand:- start:1572 stop:1727 length:156 start_codon:yes stop_codon:yes gene_type:complete